MDSGDVIPGLNEDWNFGGAKLMEWAAGLVMFMMANEFFFTNTAKSMPILLMVWIATTFGLANIRKKFPDEERGIRNVMMVLMGFPPPGIPVPAVLQPVWSGAPLRELPVLCDYRVLELDKVFELSEEMKGDTEESLS